MDRTPQARLATELGTRHREGPIVVLPNAFDVATARLIAGLGPAAIGTTSAAMAAIAGYPDGEFIDPAQMLDAIARVVDAVDIGVTADIEAGYGDGIDDVRAIAGRLIEIGAIGCNLQDTGHHQGAWAGGLLPIGRASAKIATIRSVADELGIPLVINARTDTFLEDGDQVAGAIERGNAYLAAGADSVFAPGVVDADEISRLVHGLRGRPLNIYASAHTPSVSELEALGVRRVSVGCGPYQACLALVERATRELLTSGTYDTFTREQLSVGEMTALLCVRDIGGSRR
jgi:2-methylisocitrate lyase-like PEP mutase family enzyme